MSFLKEREFDLRRLEDREEGAALKLLRGQRRQNAADSGLVPSSPDLADVDAVEVAQDVLERDPEHAVVVAVSWKRKSSKYFLLF